MVRRDAIHDAVHRLKVEDGGDILVFGSVPVWNDLLAVGLVDELHVMVGNGVLGEGVPAFTRRASRSGCDCRRRVGWRGPTTCSWCIRWAPGTSTPGRSRRAGRLSTMGRPRAADART